MTADLPEIVTAAMRLAPAVRAGAANAFVAVLTDANGYATVRDAQLT